MTISARIFINYRRSDSAGWARQLHGELGARFGAERVFRDVGIEPGVDFVEHIEHVMDACEVCIAVIGPHWADTTSAAGGRRLDDPEDLVRREIQRALERSDVHVIPVLVDGARMPAEHELPPELRPLARRNACELTDARWSSDLDVLCRCLCTVLGESTVGHARRRAPDRRPGGEAVAEPAAGLLVPVLLTLAAVGCAGVAAAALSQGLKGRGADSDWDRLAAYAVERGMIWAIVGAIVAAAVAAAFGRVRAPLGHAFMGAGAGWLGGAAGGAGYVALKRFGGVTEDDASWLLQLVQNGLPGLALARVLARAGGTGGAHYGECALAALGGAVIVAVLPGEARGILVTEQAVMVVGAVVAVLATVAPHAARASRAGDLPRGSRLVGVAGAAARALRRHRPTPPVR